MKTEIIPENSDLCIIGHEEVARGYKVKEDKVLNLIRTIKKTLGMKLRNNRLYVCEKHKEEYLKKRKSFERNMMLLSAMASILFIMILVVNLMSGDLMGILRSILLGAMIFIAVLLFILFVYVPGIEEKEVHAGARVTKEVNTTEKKSKEVRKVKYKR